MVPGFGTLHYSLDEHGYRLVVDADPEIVNYYRALVPKSIRLNRTRFAPHITVIRETTLPNPALWAADHGATVEFQYLPVVKTGEVYYVLWVFCDALKSTRQRFGLPATTWYTRPPDDTECFHLTIGNLKGS